MSEHDDFWSRMRASSALVDGLPAYTAAGVVVSPCFDGGRDVPAAPVTKAAAIDHMRRGGLIEFADIDGNACQRRIKPGLTLGEIIERRYRFSGEWRDWCSSGPDEMEDRDDFYRLVPISTDETDAPEFTAMAERLRLFVAAMSQCKAALEKLDSVPRGRIVDSLRHMYKADVDAYIERSLAVVEALAAELAQDDADALAAMEGG